MRAGSSSRGRLSGATPTAARHGAHATIAEIRIPVIGDIEVERAGIVVRVAARRELEVLDMGRRVGVAESLEHVDLCMILPLRSLTQMSGLEPPPT